MKKNCLGPRIKYYNSIDICYSKKIVYNVEIRTLFGTENYYLIKKSSFKNS